MTRPWTFWCWLAWLSAVAPLVGCFTQPINRPPSVQLAAPAPGVMRGKGASFTVVATDPDGDPLSLTWAVVEGECPRDAQSWQGDRRAVDAGRQVMVESSATLGPFCVCVFAVDSHNASDANCLPQMPVNRAPEVKLRVVAPGTLQPFPRFSRVRVSAAGTVDPDGAIGEMIRYQWGLERPTSSQAELGDCDPAAELDRCFTGDASGRYAVTLQATDSQGEKSSADPVMVQIAPDRLPCIRETTPALTSLTRDDRHDAPQSILVDKVEDDGNPYPASSSGRIQFAWYTGLEGGPMSSRENDFNTFAPVGYRLGDVVRVRVEIRDGQNTTIDDILNRCQLSGDALCESPPGSGCFLSVTWTVRFNL